MSILNSISTISVDKWCVCPVAGIPVGSATALSNTGKTVQDIASMTLATIRGKLAERRKDLKSQDKHAKEYIVAKDALLQHLTFIAIGILRIVPLAGAYMTWSINIKRGSQLIKAGDQACTDKNYVLALSLYEQAVACTGSAEVMLKIGKIYESEKNLNGKSAEELKTLCFQWMNRSADAGNVIGLYKTGKCYLSGNGVAKDEEKGFSLLKKAAVKGYDVAQLHLGTLLVYQNEVITVDENDIAKKKEFYRLGIDWLNLSAAQGNLSAKYYLGYGAYNKLWGLNLSNKEIFDHLTAAAVGVGQAHYWLGRMYFEGNGYDADGSQLSKDSDAAKKCAFNVFETASKEESPNPGALYLLGKLYEKGFSTIQSDSSALGWYQLAAEKGHIASGVAAGDLLFKLNTADSLEKALEYYEKAATAGHVEAQYKMGLMYTEYRSRIPSLRTKEPTDLNSIGHSWLLKAAKANYAEAYLKLGNYHFNREFGCQRAADMINHYYKKGAELGHIDCLIYLSLMYNGGMGMENGALLSAGSSLARQFAFYWMQRAAENGSPDAQLELTRMYSSGEVIVSDTPVPKESEQAKKEALAWLKKVLVNPTSTKDLLGWAHYCLGQFYSTGYGLEKSRQKALEHYQRAVELNGHPEAQDKLSCFPMNRARAIGKRILSHIPFLRD